VYKSQCDVKLQVVTWIWGTACDRAWRTNLITNSHITNPSPSRGKTPARIKYYWYTALDVTRNLNLLRACSTGVYNSRIHSMKLRSLGANPQTLRS